MADLTDGWVEYRKLVLSEIERLTVSVEKLRDELGTIRSEIVGLKVKAGIWGLIGGAIPVAIGLATLLLS